MEYLPLLVPLILLLMIPTSMVLMYFRDEIRLSRRKLLAFFKPKSELDREIANEKKEIKFLTEQKAKIDHLRDLKREKDKLYWEIKTDEYEASSGETVYMPIKKWSVDNFKSDEINIESIKADEWNRCEQCGSTKVTGYRRDYGGGAFKYFEHCSDCGISLNTKERMK